MSKQENDILLIRKYLNGELDARAMYKLERRAQDDPFLMDALAGYESNVKDETKNLHELTERLQQRVAKKERRLIPFRLMAIAALVLIFLTAVLLWFINRQPEAKLLSAKVAIVPVKKHGTIPVAINNQSEIAELKSKSTAKTYLKPADNRIAANKRRQPIKGDPNAEIMIDGAVGNSVAAITPQPPPITAEAKKDSAPLNEMVALGYAAQKKAMLNSSVAAISLGIPKGNVVKGLVKDASGPLPGATIKIKGTNTIAQTDVNGRFRLNAVPDNSVLVLNFVGYEPKEVTVNKRDSLVIAMVPDSKSLNEVTVVSIGYGAKKTNDDDDAEQYLAAHPANGWSAFKKYLKDKAVSPDGKNGTVKLSFMVNADNSISDFKIINSVSAKTDSAAIELVEDGDDWITNTNNKPEKVKVKVKFEAKK